MSIIIIFIIPLLLRISTLSNFYAFSLAGLLISEPSNLPSDADNGNVHYPTFLRTIAESLISEPFSPISEFSSTPNSENINKTETPYTSTSKSTEEVLEQVHLSEAQDTLENTARSIQTFDSHLIMADLFKHYMMCMENNDTTSTEFAIKSLAYASQLFTREQWAANEADIRNGDHVVSLFLQDLKDLGPKLDINEHRHLCHLQTSVAMHNLVSGAGKEISPENMNKVLKIYFDTLNKYINL